MCVCTCQIVSHVYTRNMFTVHIGHLIQNLLSNQSRFNMFFWVPRNMGGFVAIKQHSIGVSYLNLLDFFLSLYKTCAILITCSVKYMQWCGQCVLTALCPSRVSEAWLYKLSDWRCGVSRAHGGDPQVCSLEARPAELFFPALRPGNQEGTFHLMPLGTAYS